jgi:Protein of unknown function (DUF2497)
LATIREAIDNGPDMDTPAPSAQTYQPAPRAPYVPPAPPMQNSTSHNEQGTLMRGALREMRVSYGGEPDNREQQISELRERVQRYSQDTYIAEPQVAPAPTDHGFGGILSGRAQIHEAPPPPSYRTPSYAHQRPRYAPEEDMPLRNSYADDDGQSDIHYQQQGYAPSYEPQHPDDVEAQWQAQQHAAYQEQYNEPEPPRYEPARRAPRRPQQALISNRAEQASRASFDELADVIMARAGGDRGIEDLTRDLLRGLLRNWLDEHLPEIVESMVRAEIERVARGR